VNVQANDWTLLMWALDKDVVLVMDIVVDTPVVVQAEGNTPDFGVPARWAVDTNAVERSHTMGLVSVLRSRESMT
jgi:hypothetical protein